VVHQCYMYCITQNSTYARTSCCTPRDQSTHTECAHNQTCLSSQCHVRACCNAHAGYNIHPPLKNTTLYTVRRQPAWLAASVHALVGNLKCRWRGLNQSFSLPLPAWCQAPRHSGWGYIRRIVWSVEGLLQRKPSWCKVNLCSVCRANASL